MNTEDEPLEIIGNESNFVYQLEPGTSPAPKDAAASSQPAQQEELKANGAGSPPIQMSNDLATNDGSVIETLDTAFHGKPGVAEGSNPSGSDRAGYYEERSQGKSDAQEEAGFANGN